MLSPFDRLIHDRARSEELFGFRFRLEIYVPKAKREFGYFVMPILHGDRVVGRLDPVFDRAANMLRVAGCVRGAGRAAGRRGRRSGSSSTSSRAWVGADGRRAARRSRRCGARGSESASPVRIAWKPSADATTPGSSCRRAPAADEGADRDDVVRLAEDDPGRAGARAGWIRRARSRSRTIRAPKA